MDKEDIEYRRQVVNTYKPDVEKLIRYLPWLEEKSGSNVQETFVGIYSRHRTRTVKDELAAIERSGIREMDVLKGILSKYVLGGMTKGKMWTEAVYNRIFLNVVRKMKENLEFWDKPMR